MSKRELSWYSKVADLMAKTGKSIFAAAIELDIPITQKEAEAHFHGDEFQKVLRASRARIYGDLSNDPGHNKRTLIGKLIRAAEILMDSGKADKAAEVLHKIAKIEGWDKSENAIQIFGELTQKEFSEIRTRLHEQHPELKTKPFDA